MNLKKYSTCLTIVLLLSFNLFSQADLVLYDNTIPQSSISKGDILPLTFSIANFGNVASDITHIDLFLNTGFLLDPPKKIGRVSLPNIAPNTYYELTYLHVISQNQDAGNYYIEMEIDPNNNVIETDNNNYFCISTSTSCVQVEILNSSNAFIKLPYPIIFIHGLVSDSNTWEDFKNYIQNQYGWSYGGRMDFCLNPDDNQSSTDNYNDFLEHSDFLDWQQINPGDFYVLNFDVNVNGALFQDDDWIPFNDDYSNQSAITKQGWAVDKAVNYIRNLTQTDKVILVGHSMGGLAAREYIQNPRNGEQFAAKLLTVGTPNGGSNFHINIIEDILGGVDSKSEALRDLRYQDMEFSGIYLNGGMENPLDDYHNNDINCNNFLGDDIIGLNQRSAPSDVNYSCIIGNFLNQGGDGVVSADKADLSEYLNPSPPFNSLYVEKYTVSSIHTSIHTSNHRVLVESLDEPTFYDLSYELVLNTINYGFITTPPVNHPILSPNDDIDFDDYVFTIDGEGIIDIEIFNIPVSGFAVFLLDANYNVLVELQGFGESNLQESLNLSAGTYYLEIAGISEEESYLNPYSFQVSYSPSSNLTPDFSSTEHDGCTPMIIYFDDESLGNPTSWNWSFPGGTPSSSTQSSPSVIYATPGIYDVSLTVSNSGGSQTVARTGYVRVGDKPVASFVANVQQDNVIFENQSSSGTIFTQYTWEFGDGTTYNGVATSHIYENAGTYTVRLTAENECGSHQTAQSITIEPISSINEIAAEMGLKVYPNPVNEYFTFEIDSEWQGVYELSLQNVVGQAVWSKVIRKSSEVFKGNINTEHLPAGSYFLSVKGEKIAVLKVIIQ